MMKDQKEAILDTMCAPGPMGLSASDLSFLDLCDDFSILECCDDTVKGALGMLSQHDFSGVKNLAVSICANEHDQQISYSEIGGLRDVCTRLNDDTNVMWGFGFSDVRTGQRKVTVLLAK